METNLEIADVVVWYKHIESQSLRGRLEALAPEEEIMLEADNVVGRWQRLKTGKDGRPVYAIRPIGAMKDVWGTWYKSRKGQAISLRPLNLADDYLMATAALFSEWSDPADEEAFRDL